MASRLARSQRGTRTFSSALRSFPWAIGPPFRVAWAVVNRSLTWARLSFSCEFENLLAAQRPARQQGRVGGFSRSFHSQIFFGGRTGKNFGRFIFAFFNSIGQSRLGGASCRSSHVRNAPLATVGPKKAACR
jgi:hypothetical protein